MTRKDYEQIAAALQGAWDFSATAYGGETLVLVRCGISISAEALAEMLAKQSAGFEIKRFLVNCGVIDCC